MMIRIIYERKIKDLIVKIMKQKRKHKAISFFIRIEKKLRSIRMVLAIPLKKVLIKIRYLVISKLRAKTYEDRYQVDYRNLRYDSNGFIYMGTCKRSRIKRR
jgi:hypothetical protein